MTGSIVLALVLALSSASYGVSQSVPVSPRTGFILTWDLLDWHEAFQTCRASNWTLAYPSSSTEGETLLSFLVNVSDNSTKDIHLGFHSLFHTGNYVNMQGRDMDTVGFWQWDPQSENGTDQRCGALTVRGMKTIDCSTRMQSICQFQESIEDFDKIEGFGYYKLFLESGRPLNWTDAVAECILWNAGLLVLHSPAEYQAIFTYYSDLGFISGTIDIFYGAHQMFGDHWFLTLADEPLEDSGYDLWAPGEPGDVTAADFPLVGLRLTDPNTPEAEAGMFVLPSGTPMPFICERDLH